MTLLTLPLELHGPPPGFHDGGFSLLPFFGLFPLLLLLLAGLGFYLWRQGKLTLPDLGRRPSPEEEAKRTLANRFANGDLSTDEFMERSSILNWTPGSEAVPTRRPRPGRR